MSRSITADLVVDLSSELGGFSAPVLSAAWDGSVLAVARRSTELPGTKQRIGVFPKSRLDAPTDYLVLRWSSGKVERLCITGEHLLLHFVQPLSDGRVLAVSARAHWRREGAEQNGVVYDRDGRARERFLLGDGIEDVRTTPAGTIWVSYFDEGVFGNFGWGHPGPIPLGAPGLREFSERGEPRFAYDAEQAGTDPICDAYALNVAPDGSVWVYFYTEFPIVRIRSDEYRVWQCGTAGARAVAIDGERALLVGDYKVPARGRIVHLGPASNVTDGDDVIVVDPTGAPLNLARPCAVGTKTYFFDGARAYVVRAW
jgi:hypothetical protein